jgi:UDP-N-acetylglucosamine 2-epimerase (non-hydrolysing)
VLGTRPEVIKLAPLIRLARSRPHEIRLRIVLTGQHRELSRQMMSEFDLQADVDLDLMHRNQGLAAITADCLRGLSEVLAADRPDWVLVQGDTTTTLAASLAAFYNGIRVGHVEAGLRTGCRTSPFPEEMNRRLTSCISDVHFAPTERARRNLLEQGVADDAIVVTGNTGIDALFEVRRAFAAEATDVREPYVLATVHRRENHGEALGRICDGLLALLDRHRDVTLLLPLHPSPRVHDAVVAKLGGHPRAVLSAPLGYSEFQRALVGAALVLTDSGGIQEECAALGKPVLVLRAQTERQEAVEAGVAVLVGTCAATIADTASALLTDRERYRSMARPTTAFGDGTASARILDALRERAPSSAAGRP